MLFRRATTVVLSVLMLAGVLTTAPRTASAQEPTNDELRELAVGEAIAAFESYEAVNGTYLIPGTGFQGDGQGPLSLIDGVDYVQSMSAVLVADGHLTAEAVPADPTTAANPDNDFWVFLCNDRIGVFALSDGITPTAEDQQWWDDNTCSRDPFDLGGRTYFQLSEPHAGPTNDELRELALADIVVAFEAYGVAHGTYRVDGAGYQQTGIGRFSDEGNDDYLVAFDTVFVDEGFLDAADVPTEPTLSDGPEQDFVVHLCVDRVGIFSLTNGIAADAVDQQWWTDNGCSQQAADSGKPYFQLSDPVDSDPHRITAVTEVVAALDAYAADNFTHVVADSGFEDGGSGWFSLSGVESYDAAIADALVAAGYLTADAVPEEPTLFDDYTSGFIVGQCLDRAGVFSLSEGVAPPSEDAAWWAANGCDTAPIDGGHSYFQLTQTAPVAPPTDDDVRRQAVDDIVIALEAYAADYSRFAIAGAGDADGEGWFSASGIGDYSVAIADKLAELGYLDANALPADPTPGYDNGFIIHVCGERAAVFAKPSASGLEPSAEDAAWQVENDCGPGTITAGWTYFKLTGPSGLDAARVAAVSEAVAALDAFAAVNYTHIVPGVGQDGNGNGWFSLDGFSNYQVATSDELIRLGFLDPAVGYEDPVAAVHYRHGVRVEFCGNRAAVFALSNGITPAAEDAAWWSDNNCTTAAIDGGRIYFQLSDPAPEVDTLRVDAVNNLVTALELYALDNYTPSVFNAGYNYEGRGYTSVDGLLSYRNSITGALISGGYLDGSSIYEEPTLAGDYRRGFVIQICGNRAAVFSYSDGIETSVEDEQWWSDNNCGRSTDDRPYFQVTAPAPNPDPLREAAVTNLVTALEAYALENYAPTVYNAGYEYEGRGYASLGGTLNYRTAITDRLIAQGYLDAESQFEDPTFSGRYQRGFVIQVCGDRAAVFSFSNGIETSAEDEAWWSDNNCGRSTADRPYFQVTTAAPSPDPLREAAVTTLVAALESYAQTNYTNAVHNAGYQYEGRGYTSLGGTLNHRNAITDALIAQGHLDANSRYEDPNQAGRYQRGFVLQHCGDRAAVFSFSNGIETSAEDEAWWSDNNCGRSTADHTYFQVTAPAPDPDPVRAEALAAIVDAYEAYAVDNYTYTLTGAGFENLGYGYFNFDNDQYYDYALSTFLSDRGYLDSNDVPADPATAGIKARGFNVRLCEDRAAVFSLSNGGLETSAEDLAWWTANSCVGATEAHTYFALTAPAPVETLDDQREDAVDQAIAALQAYGIDNLTYAVAGAGGNGRGQGWYQRYNGGSYPASIVSVLVAEGYLDGDNILVDPLDTVIDSHSSYDLMVYHCEDRVGVFAKSDGVAPSAEDAAWWADNNCLTAPIERHDHTYFQLADPLPLDEARVIAVTQVVDALESYGTENVSYSVPGGARGKGQGWYQHENNSTYRTSIMNALIDAGHLDADTVLVDPLDIVEGSHSEFDFMIYLCADRVGVFSQTKALTPSAEDETWWADNGCTRAPIDKHNHTYFQLADALALDSARLTAVTQVVDALESYGHQNGAYRVDGGGGRGNGQGWYQHDNGASYPASIQSVLIDGGHLDADNLLVDPLDIVEGSHSEFDFMIYRCADRVGVFSRTKALSPSIDDEIWWADNGCTRAPIDRYNHTYFQLAAPLEGLDEEITVRYTPSSIPGYKIATIIVRPQGDPLGLVIGAATLVSSGANAQGGAGGGLAFATFQENNATEFTCAEGVTCRLGNDGVAGFVSFNSQGWSTPFEVGDFTVPDTDVVVANTATLTVDEMLQEGFDDDTDFTYFAADAGAILDYIPEPTPDFGGGLTGRFSQEGTWDARCDRNLYSGGINWDDFYMEWPADIDLKAIGGGLRWEWSFVEYSRDCYQWETWAQDKNGNYVNSTRAYGFETNRFANVPGGQYKENVAELCINVSGLTWIDQARRDRYWGQQHPFHGTPESDGDTCKPIPRNWGDTNCDGKTDFDDIAAYGSRDIIIEVIGSVPNRECSTAFERDVTWDGVVDFRDGEFIFDCLMMAKDNIVTEECARLGIVVEEATNPPPVEPPTGDGEEPTAPPSENGVTVSGTADDVPFGPFDFGPEGGPIPVPGDATGKICLTVKEKGAPGTDTAAGTTVTCYLTPPKPTLSVDGTTVTATWPDIDDEIGSLVRWYHDPADDDDPDNDVLLTPVPVPVASSSNPTTTHDATGRTGAMCVEVLFQAPDGVDDSVWSTRTCLNVEASVFCASELADGPTLRAEGFEWDMDYRISGDDGLVLTDIFLGPRKMAEMVSIPYLLVTKTDGSEVRIELADSPLSGDCPGATSRSQLLSHGHAPVDGKDTLRVEANYQIDQIDGLDGVLTVTQGYEFDEELADGDCEAHLYAPNPIRDPRVLPCSPYRFTVTYDYDGADEFESIEIPQRLHFKVGEGSSSAANNTSTAFLDHDTLPEGTIRGPVTPFPFTYERTLPAIIKGQQGDVLSPDPDLRRVTIDNYHQTFLDEVREPQGFPVSKPGCPECVHLHWRWTSLVGEPQFGQGLPLIPDGSTQDLDIGVSSYSPNELDPERYDDVINEDEGALVGDPVMWYISTSRDASDSFFTNPGTDGDLPSRGGGFFSIGYADLDIAFDAEVTAGGVGLPNPISVTAVSNTGPGHAPNVVVTFTAVEGVFVEDTLPQACELANGTQVLCALGDIASGAEAESLVVEAMRVAVGTTTVFIDVKSDVVDFDESNDSLEVTFVTDFVSDLELTGSASTVSNGDLYELMVENREVGDATDVELIVDLPAGVDPASVDVQAGDSDDCSVNIAQATVRCLWGTIPGSATDPGGSLRTELVFITVPTGQSVAPLNASVSSPVLDLNEDNNDVEIAAPG